MNQISPLNPRTVSVTLLQGEDQAELDRLDAEVVRLAPKKGDTPPVRTADEVDPHTEAKRARAEFAAEAEERGVTVVLRALGRKTWRKHVLDHPPRDGKPGDEQFGVNITDFPETLVPASIASPVFSSETEREAFLDSLTDVQFEMLFLRAFNLNRALGADPKDARL